MHVRFLPFNSGCLSITPYSDTASIYLLITSEYNLTNAISRPLNLSVTLTLLPACKNLIPALIFVSRSCSPIFGDN